MLIIKSALHDIVMDSFRFYVTKLFVHTLQSTSAKEAMLLKSFYIFCEYTHTNSPLQNVLFVKYKQLCISLYNQITLYQDSVIVKDIKGAKLTKPYNA